MKRQEAQGPQGRVRSVAIELVLEIDVRISDYGYRYISSCSDVRLRCSRSSTNTRTFCVGARTLPLANGIKNGGHLTCALVLQF